MGRKRHTPEQIITALREAEVGLARGKSVKLISRELGITEQTYYRWRREYGGMKVSQARCLKELERENGRLKRAVADLTLDKVILEEALSANVRETRSTQRIRVGRRQRKRTCWDCEREWKRMVVPLEPGRPSEARQLLRTRR